MVERVGERGEVVADAAAHRDGDLLAARLLRARERRERARPHARPRPPRRPHRTPHPGLTRLTASGTTANCHINFTNE